MDKKQAVDLISTTFNNNFDKQRYRNFIINLLDGIDESKEFNCGNAYVPESFRNHVNSYGRLGKYTAPEQEEIEILWVNLKNDTSLERARTVQRNFVAWYLNGGRGGVLRNNALVAFYNDSIPDWRFSFVKLDISLKQDDKGKVKIVNEFTPAKRYSFLVGELEPNHTAQSRLVSVLSKEFPTLKEIEEAFNVEKVSKEFFANYKELFLSLVENLKSIRANDERINYEFTLKSIKEADFCKKLLGQLVFLYFIQKKGWLGVPCDKKWGEGDKQFLRHTFERAVNNNENFFNDYLEPLFYDALANGERDNNYFGLLNCKIPFLNGGLFETIGGYDWVNTDIVFENEIFSNSIKTKNGDIGTGILDVFDRYNFTVKEDEPLEKEVAVDPEMLGKVFEELLEVEDRKSKGAFYTPREIVHYMCQESLINYLVTELGIDEEKVEQQTTKSFCSFFTKTAEPLTKQDISDFIHHSDKISQLENIATEKEDINSKYKHILSTSIKDNAKQIDDALASIKVCDPAIGSGAFPVGMLNEIVRARIALVESGYLPQAKKRSVYEYKRQAIQNSIYGVDIEAGAVEIAKLRLWLSLVVDEEDIENIKALPNLDYKIVCGNSLLNVERNLFNDNLFKQLEELKPQFFNETNKSEKRRLKKQIDAIFKELTKDGTFDFEIYFSEVFNEKGGFDVIIANPPYVSAKTQVTDKKLCELRNILSNDKCYQTLYQKWDLYIAFMEKGLRLLSKNSISCMIIPYPLTNQIYAKRLRELVINEYNLIEIVDLNNIKIFESATVCNCITFIKNESPKLSCNISTLKDNVFKIILKQSYQDLIPDKKTFIWNLSSKKEIELKHSNLNILGDYCYVSVGMVLNANEKIAHGEFTKKDLISEIKTDVHSKKYLEAKDFTKYHIKRVRFLEWNTERCPNKLRRPTFPELYDRPKLLINGLGAMIATVDYDNLSCEQSNRICILWKDLKGIENKSISSSIKKFSKYKRYVMENLSETVNLKYLCAIVNSKYGLQLLNSIRGGDYHIVPEHIRNIPIPHSNPNLISNLTNSVDKILAITQTEDYLTNTEKQNAVKEYEKQIDIMVYKLYELTYDEVLTIDKDFTLTQEEYENYVL